MSRLLDAIMSALGIHRAPKSDAPPDIPSPGLQCELLRLLKTELDRDLQSFLAAAGNEKARQDITVTFKARSLILDQDIPHLDSGTMEALVTAYAHPEFNALPLILDDPVRRIKKREPEDSTKDVRAEAIRNVALFFDLLHETGMNEETYPIALAHLGQLTDNRDLVSLRQEPDDYLRALLRLFMEMPMEAVADGSMHPELLEMIKSDPSCVDDIMSFAIQRNLTLKNVDPGVYEEAAATPSVALREGAL